MTPDTSLNLAQATFTILFTSVSEPPSTANILPRYLNTFTVCIGPSPSFMFSSLCGVGIYSVLVLLMRSPCLSNWSLHLSNSCSTFSLDVSQSTISSENSIDSGGLLPSSLAKHPWLLWKGGDRALSLDGGLPLSWSNQRTHLLSVFGSGCLCSYLGWPWCILLAHSFFPGSTRLTPLALYHRRSPWQWLRHILTGDDCMSKVRTKHAAIWHVTQCSISQTLERTPCQTKM